MKKSVFALVLAMMLIVTATASAMTAGTFEAEAPGVFGEAVKVAVTVSDTVIENVEVVSHNETAGISDAAIERIPAAIVEASPSRLTPSPARR